MMLPPTAGSPTGGFKATNPTVHKVKTRQRENSRATVSSQSTNNTLGTSKSVSFSKDSPLIVARSPQALGPMGVPLEDSMVRLHLANMFVNYADDNGAISSEHPGVVAEVQISHAFLYIGQALPDDIMVPPIKANGVPLCLVTFAEFEVTCNRLHDDTVHLSLKHRVFESTTNIVVMTHAADHHASSSLFPMELSAAAERIDAIINSLKRVSAVTVSSPKHLSVASVPLSVGART